MTEVGRRQEAGFRDAEQRRPSLAEPKQRRVEAHPLITREFKWASFASHGSDG